MAGDVLISDTECYPNFWSIGFLRHSDKKLRVFEHSVRKPLTDEERDLIRAIMRQNTIVGYNFNNYDAPMIAVLLDGADNARLKQANDRIIVGGMKPWHAEDVLGVVVPRWKIIDLMEPQPNAFAGLKTLAGRMHAPFMQDLPYQPDQALTPEEMDRVLSYMGNDLENTALLYDALEEPLALRTAISAEYDIDVMSKSDAQTGEAIIKKRVEKERGQRVYKVDTPGGTMFKYPVPDWLAYQRDDLRVMLERLRGTEFMVQHNGKVALPEWLAEMTVVIGDTIYQMGIGGLHSTESNRSIHSDDERVLLDFDVASYYPAIIINSGLYPRALGPQFLVEYRKIRDERVVAKRAGEKSKAEGLKIALNGCFGKLGSPYSVLYAPHLMIFVTLTGQLALLMLIERAEAAGIPVVSGNTDGVVFHCPRDREADLLAITAQWERDTGFDLERTAYRSLYNASVNSYIAIKEDGKAKWKGPIANPWRSDDGWKPDIRGYLMKNPQMQVIANAVVDLILYDRPLEQTIRASQDIRDFVTVVKVDGGATWNPRLHVEQKQVEWTGTSEVNPPDFYNATVHDGPGQYLGKVVRFYWAKNGAPIYKAKPHASTGNYAKVPKSDGCRPAMELPSVLPDDVDYEAYIAAAGEVLMDLGYTDRPRTVKPLRVWKHSAVLHWAVAV
jgi:hypothetical protein